MPVGCGTERLTSWECSLHFCVRSCESSSNNCENCLILMWAKINSLVIGGQIPPHVCVCERAFVCLSVIFACCVLQFSRVNPLIVLIITSHGPKLASGATMMHILHIHRHFVFNMWWCLWHLMIHEASSECHMKHIRYFQLGKNIARNPFVPLQIVKPKELGKTIIPNTYIFILI